MKAAHYNKQKNTRRDWLDMKETDMPNTEIYGVTRDIIPRLNWTTVTMQPFLTKWLFQERLSHMKTKKEWVESYLDDSPIKPAKFCVIAEQPESLIGFWLSKEDMDSFFLNLDRITFHLKDALGVIDVRSESKLIHTFPFVQEDERLWAGLQSLEAYRRQSLDLLRRRLLLRSKSFLKKISTINRLDNVRGKCFVRNTFLFFVFLAIVG